MSGPPKNDPPAAGDRLLDMVCAGALAWALPGSGHWLAGHRRHGAAVAVAVGFLWITGLLVGGFSVVDGRPAPAGSRAWFCAQAGVGASMIVERAHASMRVGEAPPALALGRGREVGTLYLTAAGLLNLMAVADVMLRVAERKKPPARTADASVGSPDTRGAP